MMNRVSRNGNHTTYCMVIENWVQTVINVQMRKYTDKFHIDTYLDKLNMLRGGPFDSWRGAMFFCEKSLFSK